ncbi:MAG: RNase III inhibitor [Elusimicrobia bacterium RIFOXYD2_FULL_34_15]|nr:MAG: RNase III inhibitor [Elusimicrobia bacterium RIFOXYD2_FULL_34_15]
MTKVELFLGDITELKVDAIVNAANTTLLGGGGVDGAIHRAAGPKLLEECKKLNGCKTGEAKITKGYNLPAKYVIHTVGLVWRGGNSGEEKLLASCYKNSLELAVNPIREIANDPKNINFTYAVDNEFSNRTKNNIKSIAFPSISTGAYGFPIEKAAPIALNEVKNFIVKDNSLEKIIFVLFSENDLKIYTDFYKNF